MKVKTLLVISVLSCIFYSCKNGLNSSNKLSFETVDCQFSPGINLKLSDLAESIELLPLQTTDQSLIGTIGKLKMYQDRYYIGSASMFTDKILIFDANGKFIYKLDKRGMGPGEYIDVQDFCLLDKNRMLTISYENSRLYLYDISKDSCLFSRNLEVYPLSLLVKDKRILLFNIGCQVKATDYQSNDGFLQDYDLEGNLISTYLKLDDDARKKINGIMPMQTFNQCDGKVYFRYSFCDTLYEIKNHTLLPAFYMNFGDKKIPSDAFKNATRHIDSTFGVVKKNQGVGLVNFCEITPSWIYITFHDYEGNGYMVFYNRKNCMSLIANQIEFDLLFPGCTLNLKSQLPKCFTGDYLIWHMEPTKLKKMYTQYKNRVSADEFKKFEAQHKQIVSICENLQEEDNPVLLKIKMKKP